LDNFNANSQPQFSADDSELIFDRNNEINSVRLDGSGDRKIVQNHDHQGPGRLAQRSRSRVSRVLRHC
jgi:hypothetical protein